MQPTSRVPNLILLNLSSAQSGNQFSGPKQDSVVEPDEVLEQRLLQKAEERLQIKRKTSNSRLTGVVPDRPAVLDLESGYNSENEKSPGHLKIKVLECPGFRARSRSFDSGRNSPESTNAVVSSGPDPGPGAVDCVKSDAQPVAEPPKRGPSQPDQGKPSGGILSISRKNSGIQKRVSHFCHGQVIFGLLYLNVQ